MVEFVRRAHAIVQDVVAVGGRPPVFGALSQFLKSMNIWFWAIVGLPTLAAGVYYFAIASDLYLSETKFIVRGPSKPSASAIGALLGSGVGSAASEDTFAVHEF